MIYSSMMSPGCFSLPTILTFIAISVLALDLVLFDTLLPSGQVTKKLTHASANSSSCFRNEDRLFVCITSYNNPLRSGNLDLIIESLACLCTSSGMGIDVKLFITEFDHPYYPGQTLPRGLTIEQKWRDKELKHHFSGSCRPEMNFSLTRRTHTHYLYLEDDIIITSQNLEYLCLEFKHLDTTENSGFRPGLLRYEVKRVDSGTDVNVLKVLTDNSLCCPPQIDAVIELEGRSYIVPRNPYEASYFLTSKQLKMLSAETQYTSVLTSAKGLIREHHAGLWLSGLVTKVVPLDSFEKSLVLHISGNYVNNSLPSAEIYLKAATTYAGKPIALNQLGYEDGKMV